MERERLLEKLDLQKKEFEKATKAAVEAERERIFEKQR